MRPLFPLSALFIALFGLSGCGDSSDSAPTAKVSFSIADAPADGVKEVWVTFESITLNSYTGDKNNKDVDKEVDESNSQTIFVTDAKNKANPIRINLMDYQKGKSKRIINGAEVPVGDYSLTVNTSGCSQSAADGADGADGSAGPTDHCWVKEYDEGTKPLKTPSNKLKLGKFTVSQKDNQAYTIDIKLRSSLVNNGGGDNYNLKPHGISIVDTATVGSISGTVDINLFSAGDCFADSGNTLYLYQGGYSGEGLSSMTMGDEFDPDIDTDVPENVLMPYASTLLDPNEGEDSNAYVFGNLAAGQYTLAFSCTDAGIDQSGGAIQGDHPEFYNQIPIAKSDSQWTKLTVLSGEDTRYDFSEVE
ncbi:DUF4382 domain-containing protein [Photobacterium sagamiensis]|uniref:DUF4382 domain-containing protein n=1 Tax=Photobacterium sagamiensis TaxID=2910241 RepID=UPI003D11607C